MSIEGLIKDLEHLKDSLKEAVDEEFYNSASEYIQRIILIKKELESKGYFE